MGLHSLPGSCLAWGDPALWSIGSMVGLMVTSKKAYANGYLPGLPPPVLPSLWGAAVDPASIGHPPTLAGSFGSVSLESLLLSSGSWCVQDFDCALQGWSPCFPQSCGSPVIKSWWPSGLDSLGIPSPFVRSPGWEAWRGIQNLHKSGRTSSVLFFSRFWVIFSTSMGFDFILIAPLLLSHCGFFFFGCGVSFSCQWLFNSWLQFWCSQRRKWAHVILLRHLGWEAYWSFYCLCTSTFFRMSYCWNHTVCILFSLTSFT